MNHSDSIKNIMGALMQAQAESGVLPFDGVNNFTNSRYTTLGKVIEITQPVFRKYGLVFTSLPTGDGINIGVTYLLAHPESGEWMSETILSVVEKEPKKSLGQVAGSNVSYFRRYGISAVLNLYSDEDVDGNTGKVSTGGKQQKPQPVPASPDGGDKTQMVGVLDAITVQTIVESGLSENATAAAQVLARFEPKKAPLGKIVDKFRLYREHKIENGDTDAAINHANAKG